MVGRCFFSKHVQLALLRLLAAHSSGHGGRFFISRPTSVPICCEFRRPQATLRLNQRAQQRRVAYAAGHANNVAATRNCSSGVQKPAPPTCFTCFNGSRYDTVLKRLTQSRNRVPQNAQCCMFGCRSRCRLTESLSATVPLSSGPNTQNSPSWEANPARRSLSS